MDELIKKHLGINTPDWIIENCKSLLTEFDNKNNLDIFTIIDNLRCHLEVNAGRLAEPILKRGEDPRNDKNCKDAFLMLAHLKSISDYLNKK